MARPRNRPPREGQHHEYPDLSGHAGRPIERIRPHIRRTPVRTSDYLNELTGAEAVLSNARTSRNRGAFKVRGATNAVFGLSDEQAKAGVATHSSGNHASCLSYAAMLRGIPCNVVMPKTAPQAKKDTVARYGGRITECEPSTTSDVRKPSRVYKPRRGAILSIPITIPACIAGQGTCSKELIEQTDGLDMVVAPIGGGGHDLGHLPDPFDAFRPKPRSSPPSRNRPTMPIAVSRPVTSSPMMRQRPWADGLLVPLKDLTWHFVKNHVGEMFTASDPEIIEAMKLTWKHLRVVMEPSSAVPLAIILKNKDFFKGKRVGRDHHRRQCRSGQTALDAGVRR